MVNTINRKDLVRRTAAGAQLVDVLPPSVYKQGHLPGAINIPLTKLDATTVKQLDHGRPVIVYCHDFL